ncbi:MAG: hypothetical protein WC865_16485 [Bacteroidales bacterium]
MKFKIQWIAILIVSLSLGTGWAIRGQFGHEQGAAWAGGIGALALVLVSRRTDWYKKMLLIALSSAVGWGAGGMISYGVIAGSYAQSDNFPNVFYGLIMLFIIGGLYGLLGGGLVGLALDSTTEKKVKWGSLVAEMVAGGLITHSFLIDQIGIQMSPPRSDAWAICLGAGLALIWYLARNKHLSPLRVASYSALGGGFGFAFGTFFHLVMNWLEINFNTWNMAEYSIGFFGGMGMAYGVFSSKWPDETIAPRKWENTSAMLLLIIFIPLVIFRESFSYSRFLEKYQNLANAGNIALANTISAAIITLFLALFAWYLLAKSKYIFSRREVMLLFLVYSFAYTLLSYISTGLYTGTFLSNSNHHLYVVNIIVVVLLLSKGYPAFFEQLTYKISAKKWIVYAIMVILFFAVLALLAIKLHGETDPTYDRFPMY